MPALPSHRLTPHGALAAPIGGARASGASRRPLPDPDLVGAWDGIVELRVDGSARRVPVRLVVRPDGRVTGEIGDARLVEATVRGGRGWLARALHLGPDLSVVGRLEGAIAPGEATPAGRVRLPLERVGAELCGALQARGPRACRARMALSRCGCGT